MHFETSLGKPFLRKEMELQMKAICEGRTTKQAVLHDSISKYREVFDHSRSELAILKAVRLSDVVPLWLVVSCPTPHPPSHSSSLDRAARRDG